MTSRSAVLSLFALIAFHGLAFAAPPPARFAIVVGVNTPETSAVPRLRYADDDAVAMHALLIEAGVQSTLYATLDEDTRRLNPSVTPSGPATWNALQAGIVALERPLQDAAAAGLEPELYIFYSGHGDVAEGEGYVVLENGRLTRSRLRSLLAQSKAARKHVLIDACRSYYLAFEKGGAGKRTKLDRRIVDDRDPSGVGFVLSTSSDRESHEWDRFQGGIFSHEIRSALRGAADADGDGVVTYAELGAFLSVANQAIPNPRFRPDFMIRPPESAGRTPDRALRTALLAWSGQAAALVIDEATPHFYIEDARGVRIIDAHPAPDQRLIVRLPDVSPLFLRTSDEDREIVLERPDGRLSERQAQPVSIARKGALHLAFETLFSIPFGAHSVAEFELAWSAGQPEPAPPTPEHPGGTLGGVRRAAGWAFTGAASIGVAAHLVALQQYATGRDESQREQHARNQTISRLNTAALVAYGVATLAGVSWLGTTWWSRDADRGVGIAIDPSPGGATGLGISLQGGF